MEIKCHPQESNPDMVTHPSTNRAQRRLILLIKTNVLLLCQVWLQILGMWCFVDTLLPSMKTIWLLIHQLWHTFLRGHYKTFGWASTSHV